VLCSSFASASKQASSPTRLHRSPRSLAVYLVLDIDLGVQPSIPSFYAHYRCFDAPPSSPSLTTHSDRSRRHLQCFCIDCIDLHASASSQASIPARFIHSSSLFYISIVFLVVYLFLTRSVALCTLSPQGHRPSRSRFDFIVFASKLRFLHRILSSLYIVRLLHVVGVCCVSV